MSSRQTHGLPTYCLNEQNHYPERLQKLYFVNVSTLWITFWKYASHLVDKVTLEKVYPHLCVHVI